MILGQFATTADTNKPVYIKIGDYFQGSESVNGRKSLLRILLLSQGKDYTDLT